MATYYVKPDGNDGANGRSAGAAWRSINGSLGKISSGDELVMLDGVYYQTVFINKSGVTIRAQNRLAAIIDGSHHAGSAGHYSKLVEVTGHHVTLDGLEIRNFNVAKSIYLRGLFINGDGGGGANFIGRNLHVHHTNADNVNLWQCRNALIEDCTLHDGALENAPGVRQGDWPNSGIAMKGGGGHVIRRVTAYGGYGEICNADKACNGALIENCVFHSFWAMPYVNESTNITWRRNFIYAQGKVGFGIRNENIHNYPRCTNIVFEGNIVVGSSPGLSIDLRTWKDAGSYMDGIIIRNNTFMNCSTAAVLEGSNFRNSVIENNVFHATGNILGGGGGFVWRNNLWNKHPGGTAMGSGSVVNADLKLRNINASIQLGQGDPKNYVPVNGSPTLGIANGNALGIDYFGNDYTQNEVGALALNSVPNGNTLTADFSWDIVSANGAVTVQFADASQATNGITTRSWTYARDGQAAKQFSTEQNPRFTFEEEGSYTIVLTVTGPDGQDTSTRPNAFEVTPPVSMISADFSEVISALNNAIVVQFTDASRSTNGIESWHWTHDSGAGPVEFSTAQNPQYTFDEPGAYTIALTVTGPDGQDTSTRPDLIILFPPVANCKDNLLANGNFAVGIAGWQFYSAGDGEVTAEDMTAVVHVANNGGNSQLYQSDLTVAANTQYQLSFNASSRGKNVTPTIALIQHEPPYANLGLDESIAIAASIEEFTFTITPNAAEANARFHIKFDSDDEDILFDNFCLRQSEPVMNKLFLTLLRQGVHMGVRTR